ncbi:hypothetical protein BCR33DRAFT_813154 [Rhizoclosmatium globosum]|uniref:Uncharacterized protein n=1 Tax=Rhizoclosmatium globosum TaxID=329046 RepID=A0A1Y2AIQ2_9FUNG|nr:hypothetical protein BCR33DRAFT_813154 [Rhizoclosmatium globosum]|eukprot:ORY22406.1 hypothetical protein BCR33DRAFT_813154 [Rhizoclosmatium globosum]
MVIKRTTTIVTTSKPIVNGQVATTIRTETRVSFVSVPTSNSCIAALEAIPTDFECSVYDHEVYLSPGSVTDLIALPSLTSSLPTECLIQIFLACHSKSEDSDYDEHHGDGSNPMPRKSASKRAFRMNLTLLALDRTTRAILTNTPILWRNTIETWSFPMLRTVAPVLVSGCFDKITDLSPDVDDPVQLPETVAALLTKCHNLEAAFLYFLSLDMRILLNLVKTGPPLKLKNLVFVDLDVKDADHFFDEIQELCELMLASVENPMEVVVKPVACICNGAFLATYKSDGEFVYERNCSKCEKQLPILCLACRMDAGLTVQECACQQDDCNVILCKECTATNRPCEVCELWTERAHSSRKQFCFKNCGKYVCGDCMPVSGWIKCLFCTSIMCPTCESDTTQVCTKCDRWSCSKEHLETEHLEKYRLRKYFKLADAETGKQCCALGAVHTLQAEIQMK